jgi:RNA polymerase sigma factor (sigma-70 family)
VTPVNGTVALSVDAMRQTSEADLADFCHREHRKLVGVLTLYTGDRHLAEELAQDTLVRVVMHWRKVSRLGSPAAWAHRVALNLANSSYRRSLAQRRAETRLRSRYVDDAPRQDPSTAVALREAIAQLPERQRMALVLRYYADLAPGAIGAVMNCKEGTVSALVHQAIANLRKVPGFEKVTPGHD